MVVRYQMYQVPFVIWSIFVTSVFRNQVYFISQIQFCMLSNLQVLDLGECPENLPNNVNHLLNLRCLILQSSKLSSLPESFCTLCKLQIPRKCSTITRRYQILKWTNRLSQVERSFNGDSKAEETWSKLLWRVTSSFLRSSSISDFGQFWPPNCCPIVSRRMWLPCFRLLHSTVGSSKFTVYHTRETYGEYGRRSWSCFFAQRLAEHLQITCDSCNDIYRSIKLPASTSLRELRLQSW